MLSLRTIAGLLFVAVLTLGVTGLSHAATISLTEADVANAPGALLPAAVDSVGDQSVLLNGTPALALSAYSAPQFQTGGLSAITRAILHVSSCVCSGLRQLLAFSSPVSTESAAPVMPAPAAPAAMFLFMTGLVTVVGVARKPAGLGIPLQHPSIQVETPRVPLPGYLLLASQDALFAQDLASRIVRYSYAVESVPGIVEAASLAAQQLPALVLVDRRQPGWQQLRQDPLFKSVPIMTVGPAGLGLAEDVCAGDLEYGADSTHLCDESPRLLIAKIRALLRRSAWLAKVSTVVRAGQVELDEDRYEVRVAGQANHLPPVQFKLLKCLMESPGTVIRRQELLSRIWGEGYAVEYHTLDVHICGLRRLLQRDPACGQTIETVRSVGFKFVAGPVADEPTRVSGVWPGRTSASRARAPQRRVSHHPRMVKPVAVRTAV